MHWGRARARHVCIVPGAAGRQPQHLGGEPGGLGVAPRAKGDHKPEQHVKVLECAALLKLAKGDPEQKCPIG